MTDTMILVVTLRKAVENEEEGRALYELIKTKLANRPDVTITGILTDHLDLETE
jgi:hypothetical protein